MISLKLFYFVKKKKSIQNFDINWHLFNTFNLKIKAYDETILQVGLSQSFKSSHQSCDFLTLLKIGAKIHILIVLFSLCLKTEVIFLARAHDLGQ